jgi:ABC-2 type transport system ATP-binding protein
MGIFELIGVTKKFKSNLVLDNINLEIPENCIFGILGINGSGKTTLLKLLIGFYKSTKGQIFYDREKIKNKKIKKELGFATQDNSFYNKLTVEENINYFGVLYGLPKSTIKKNMERLLKLLELDHVRNKIAENISGGMQRRLDMACSLIHVPRVIILDEPTEDLDPLVRKEILYLIKKIKEIGTTVIITSHRLEDIEEICDKVAIIHNKKIIRNCTINELKSSYSNNEEIHIQTFPGDYSKIIKNISSYDHYYIDGHKLVIKTQIAERVLHEILHIIQRTGEKLIYVDVQKPTLEEVFKSIIRNLKKRSFPIKK